MVDSKTVNYETAAVGENDMMGIQVLMDQLKTLPEQVYRAGQEFDRARYKKNEAVKKAAEAKANLEMAKASATMGMPDTLKNELQRTSYLNVTCAQEVRALNAAEAEVLNAETDILATQREFYFKQDILTSVQKRAEVATALMKYLSAR